MAHCRQQASFTDSFEAIFPAEWYSSPISAHKSAFLLYHFLVLTRSLATLGRTTASRTWPGPAAPQPGPAAA
jgi:hypothetical protein